ncbi:MAG: DUF1049 domain-containing protein [Sedimentisphaerales bacterium]|nr:DUF1049 domain-containing protein [Sedimentisphaerales bacterium]
MPISWNKFKVYAKLTLVVILFLLVIIFLIQNRNRVSINFLFWQTPPVPKFLFILSVAGFSLLIFKISTKIGKVMHDFKQIRREEKDRQQLIEQVKRESVTDKPNKPEN